MKEQKKNSDKRVLFLCYQVRCSMIKTLDLNRKYTSILENAYKISYEHEENQIWVSSFCLPLDDPKVEKAKQIEDN